MVTIEKILFISQTDRKVVVAMRKFIINGRFLTQSITGVQRYAIELVKQLDNHMEEKIIDPTQYSFVLISPQNIKNEVKLKHIPIKNIGIFKGHLWEQIELPVYCRGELLINLCNVGPIIKRNQFVTIHDAAVFANPKSFTFVFRTWYKILLSLLCKRAKKIVTVSNFSNREIQKYCRVQKNKIKVIYEGKEQVFNCKADINILKKNKLESMKYVLAVSSLNPNKNFQSIIKAIEVLGNINVDIVIAGGTNPKVFKRSNKDLRSNVKYLGYVNDGELRALYENAICFIYPSLYEGFGLPPLEAMACGCPVIVSNVASLPEVCGDAALYCDPYSPKDIADKIKLLIANPSLQEELRQKGLERAKLFTWEKCAKETMAVIEEVLNQ